MQSGMLTDSPEEIRSEARQVLKDGLKRGVEEIVANALNQWGEHGYGLPRDEADGIVCVGFRSRERPMRSLPE